MKYTREHANSAKTYLSSAYEKIEKVFESVETKDHYNAFYNMCNRILEYCKTWDYRLKPKFYNNWLIKPFIKSKSKIYDSYSSYALSIVEKMNELIDMYTSAESAEFEYTKKYAETEERIRMERDIIERLNKEKEEEIKKDAKPIGFVQYPQKKKRKYNKRRND